MKGYFNNIEATNNSIDDDGWFHTGDVGFIDNDGFLYIIDRVKELIKYRGLQVSPVELESLILLHPDILDVAVIGKKDLEAGEIPKAFVVLKKDKKISEIEIIQWVKDRISPHKQIEEVEFVEKIPKSASGKILRRILRDKETNKY
jgi:4-coumarate--CoA ligase